MVLSKIKKDVSYPELKNVERQDLNLESNLYQLEIKNIDVIIAIGKANKKLEEKGIIYYPIYLVTRNNKVIQIGLYEIKSSDYDYTNLDVENLPDPLIYNFVTPAMLNELGLKPDIPLRRIDEDNETDEGETTENETEDELENPEIYEIPKERKDIFILTKGIPLPKVLKEETKQHAKNIKDIYRESPKDTWIEKFMKNPNYIIVDNEGGGDCLFSTIRDAFSSIAQQTSVNKIRHKLANEATEEIYLKYKDNYDMYNAELITDTNEIKELESQYLLLKSRFSEMVDRNEQKQIIDEAKSIKLKHDKLVEEKKITIEILKEYKFMKGIDSLSLFKSKIQKCDFWANTWAISTLEKILNIKIIIMSSENYLNKDTKNVLQCGNLNDPIIEKQSVFNPEFYIIVDYNSGNYKLIGYKTKLIFKFKELPYDIKKLICEKCLENNSGVFTVIPDFQLLKMNKYNKKTISKEDNFDDLSESKLRGLYDDDIILQFYSKSLDKPLPGKGNGEKIPSEKMKEFAELATIPHWRKKLSNFWVEPFMLDNHQWASVEHYYQGSKYKKTYSHFYLNFSLDSNTELSKNPIMAKAASSKLGKFKDQLLRPINIKPDHDFFGERQKKEIYNALYAKFTQKPDLTHLLLATNNAKLTHFIKRDEPNICDELMLIRNKIKQTK